MFGLPLELITMLGSTYRWSNVHMGAEHEDETKQNKMLMERANANGFVAEHVTQKTINICMDKRTHCIICSLCYNSVPS